MNIKENLSKNLIKYRKSLNLTQAELAEKLNYSDKAVSKWERSEAVPDLEVLKQIADFYGTTIDNLIEEPTQEKPKIKKITQKKRLIISLIFSGLAWLVAIVAYSLIGILLPNFSNSWLIYIYAIPISTIIFLVLSAVWGRNILTTLCTSVLIWSIALSIFLSLKCFLATPPSKLWFIFLICIPLQVLDFLWTSYKRINIHFNLIKKINKK